MERKEMEEIVKEHPDARNDIFDVIAERIGDEAYDRHALEEMFDIDNLCRINVKADENVTFADRDGKKLVLKLYKQKEKPVYFSYAGYANGRCIIPELPASDEITAEGEGSYHYERLWSDEERRYLTVLEIDRPFDVTVRLYPGLGDVFAHRKAITEAGIDICSLRQVSSD